MLNRRNLRIKAMQTLFALQQLRASDQQLAWEQFNEAVRELVKEDPEVLSKGDGIEKTFRQYLNGDQSAEALIPTDLLNLATSYREVYYKQFTKDLNFLRSQMLKEVDGIHRLFLWVMGLFVALADFEDGLYARKKSQEQQLPLFRNIAAIELIRNTLDSSNLPGWHEHQGRVSQWYREIKGNQEMAQRSKSNELSEADSGTLLFLFKHVLWKSESFQNFFEEHDRGWIENKDIIKSLTNKTIKSISADGMVLAPLSYQWEEDKQFFEDIFDSTVKNESSTQKLISERAKNWDTDRIAQVDMILLKMAITEMINFPSIPVKVTINEYIELSKKYSTPKSKQFINGILDVLATHLTENGTIKKSGRGLIDNK
ncbi:MAG: N utilization substance protein B [Cyclobacteriaceae bacterium]|nr:MAG: N utilization substance protein B [Cyclobacteriaceae bacterium]